MHTSSDRSRARRIAPLACVYFLFAAQLFVPLLGIQNDEALFATPLFEPKSWEYALTIGQRHVALMLMSYLGTLKTILYKPLLRWFGSGPWSVREPMILAAAAGLWMFYLLLRRAAGERAALIGSFLLAADTMYLLTSVYDWGPVALQHLLVIGGVLLTVRACQAESGRSLAAGCFLFGLSVWDKAVATWILSALFVPAVLLYNRELRKVVRGRWAFIAAGAFLVGALPLLIYNQQDQWTTFRGNMRFDAGQIAGKQEVLLQTVNGQALIGRLTDEARPVVLPHRSQSGIEDASSTIGEMSGHPVRNLTIYGLIFALLLTPLLRGRELRLVLFAWIAMALAWAEMTFTAGAGGSVHHIILFWPLPYVVLGVSLAAASRRIGRYGLPAVAAVTALLAVSSALVTNEYYYRLTRQGGAVAWSDAIWTLAEYLETSPSPHIFCLDWGILDSLRLIGRGKLPLHDGIEHTSRPQLTPADREAVRQMLSIPGALFIGHSRDSEIFAGDTTRLMQAAADEGMRPDHLLTIGDSFGRPTFELYHFSK